MMSELSNTYRKRLKLLSLLVLLQSIPFLVFAINAEPSSTHILPLSNSNAQVFAEMPQAFGYTVGDLIQHQYQIMLVDGAELNTDQLPAEGSLRDWLEVNIVEVEQLGQLITIRIEYQLFKGLKQTEQLIIPSIELQINRANSSNPLIIPAWHFSAGPLIPSNIRDQDIQAQALIAPKRRNIQAGLQAVFAALVIAVLAALYIFWRQGTVSFLNTTTNPFAKASQQLKQNPKASVDVVQLQNAFKQVHHAFDDTAGATVLTAGLDVFFQQRAALRSLRPQTEEFFAQSRQLFFEQQDQQARYSIAELIHLCEQYDRLLRRR